MGANNTLYKRATESIKFDVLSNDTFKSLYRLLEQCGGNQGLTLPIWLNHFKFSQFFGEQIYRVLLKMQGNKISQYPPLEYHSFLTAFAIPNLKDNSVEKLSFLFYILDLNEDGKVTKEDAMMLLNTIYIEERCYTQKEGVATAEPDIQTIMKENANYLDGKLQEFFLDKIKLKEKKFIEKAITQLQQGNFCFQILFDIINRIFDHSDLIQLLKSRKSKAQKENPEQHNQKRRSLSKEELPMSHGIAGRQRGITTAKNCFKQKDPKANGGTKTIVKKTNNGNQIQKQNPQSTEAIGVNNTSKNKQNQSQNSRQNYNNSPNITGILGQVKKSGEVKNEWFELAGKYLLVFKHQTDTVPSKILLLNRCLLDIDKKPIQLQIYGTRMLILVGQNEKEEEHWKQEIYKEVNNQKKLNQFYIMNRKIGEGGMASVMSASRRSDMKEVAVKVLDKTKMSKSPKELIAIQREMFAHKMAIDKNSVQLYDIFENDKYFYVVMQYCQTDVLSWLIDNDYNLPEEACMKIMKQVTEGISFLHSQGIIHRDLKLENLLIETKPKNATKTPVIKIADFGLSICLGPKQTTTQILGTMEYIAPEVLTREHYRESSDIWSLGVSCYALLTGVIPFSGRDRDEIVRNIVNKEVKWPSKSNLSETCMGCILELLQKFPGSRPNLSEFLNGKWFSETKKLY